MTMFQTCRTERTSRSPIESLNSAFANVLTWMRRRRQMRKSTALLDGFNDRMLADIGLRRADCRGEWHVDVRSRGRPML